MYFTLKIGNRYVCWDAWKGHWYLGPHHLSEVFPILVDMEKSSTVKRALAAYPGARTGRA